MSEDKDWNPRPRRLWGLLLTTLIVMAGGITLAVYSLGRPDMFKPGPLSAGHRMIEDCSTCHGPEKALKDGKGAVLPGFHADKVTDKTCATCHVSTPHHVTSRKKHSRRKKKRKKRAFDKKEQKTNMGSCLSCHQIHLGGKTKQPVGNKYCSSCHGFENFKGGLAKKSSRKKGRKRRRGRKRRKRKTKATESVWRSLPGADFFDTVKRLRKIQAEASTGKHPRFRNRRRRRVLRFNHNLHLKKLDKKFYQDAFPGLVDSVYNKQGQVSCGFCHKFDKSKKNAVGVNFERNCKSCHQKQDLQDLDHSVLSSSLKQSKHKAMKNCSACHKVRKQKIVSLKTTARPWGKFSHGPHVKRMDCSSCHKKISGRVGLGRSFKMPPSKTCVDCHDGRKASDNCVSCHAFHPGEHDIRAETEQLLKISVEVQK